MYCRLVIQAVQIVCSWGDMSSRNDGLFDDAAEESDDQEQEDQEQNAEGEGEERAQSQAGSDVDSSDEEEGGNEYDMTDKFIAPEDEEEAGDESESDEEGGRRKKRKRRRREEEELDEEDFALLEEQGVRVDVSLLSLCIACICHHFGANTQPLNR